MWETSGREVGDNKRKLIRPKAPRVGDKWKTSVNSYGPKHSAWETSTEEKCKFIRPQGDKCGKQVRETSVGGKCRLMQPRKPRVGDKSETSVNSCGPRHPEWETSVEDKCKLIRPKGDKCGKQVQDTSVGGKCRLMQHREPRMGDKSWRPV